MTRRRLFVVALVLPALLGPLAGCETRTMEMAEASGRHNLKIRNYDAAASDFGYVVEKYPGRFDSHKGYGAALLGAGQPTKARSTLEVAYTLRPNDDEVVELLAEAMLQSGDTTAMTRLLRERATQKQRVSDWLRLGHFEVKAKDYDLAKSAFLTAARLDKGTTVEPQLALADLYAALGDTDRETERLRMALYLAPRNEDIADRLEALGFIAGPTAAVRPSEME